ncbi:MAG: hypothetical protein CM15mV2_1750 [uncultured marine virus]|nr:MAG: hypothetical protein CM15mV2_1750 [uncultured marine virus]
MMEGLNKPIALHVRRTDYAQYGHHPIVGLDYYEKHCPTLIRTEKWLFYQMILHGVWNNPICR